MSKKPKLPKLIDWFICDDVRRELGGKRTYVGVYRSDIILSQIPATIPQLFIVSKWDLSGTIFKKMHFRLKSPSNKILGDTIIGPPNKMAKDSHILNIAFFPFEFPEIGEYKILNKIDGAKEKIIGRFEIKLSQ